MSASARGSHPGTTRYRHSAEHHTAVSRPHGLRWRSKTKLFGFPLCEVALGRARGERLGHARAVIAVGNIADGIIALGGISRGAIAIGGLSCGLCSVGGVSLGLIAALGGVAVAPLALGGVAAGLLAIGGTGWDMHGRLHHAAASLTGFLPAAVTALRPEKATRRARRECS